MAFRKNSAGKPVRVFIADPHTIFREGIKKIIENDARFTVAGESVCCPLSDDKTDLSEIDLLLIFAIPLKAGIEAGISLKQLYPDLTTVLLTNNSRHPDLFIAIEGGFSGIIHKAVTEANLLEALNDLANGHTYYSPEVIANIQRKRAGQAQDAGKPSSINWTDKEREILKLIAKGHNNDEIAQLMDLKVRTIEGHKSRMALKANVPNTVNLVLFALKYNILELSDL